ncbi:MAG: hypothetical protein V4515_00170 [Chloroflexota bacterium]
MLADICPGYHVVQFERRDDTPPVPWDDSPPADPAGDLAESARSVAITSLAVGSLVGLALVYFAGVFYLAKLLLGGK